jgi:replicative DNA helicase
MQVVNLEAEQGYLGCIMKKGDLIKETALQDFQLYENKHRILFRALRAIEQKNEPITIITIISNIGQADLSRIGGKKYLSQLLNSIASLEPFKTYEKYILESWKLREARRIQSQEITSLEDLSNTMHELSKLELNNTEKEYNHKQALQEMHANILDQPQGLSGIDTGFKDYNKYLDGFQNGDLIISAARPSVGKTAKMLNHAIKHGENGGLVAIFSLEMGKEALNKRMISTIGSIDGHKMKNPNQYFNSDDWERYSNAIGVLGDMNMYIYDTPGQKVSDIRSKVMQLKRKFPDTPLLIMIDYLQLMRPDRKAENKNVEVGEITRSLKQLARESNSPVYLLSQLSRKNEARNDKRPMMSDLRDSGSVEQDADVIELLYRDDYYDQQSDNQNIIEVIIAKQRNGKVGTVQLAYIKEYNLFADLSVQHES